MEKSPRSLSFAVALIAASMLLVELVATRIFSVLFYYHYSFFAISLIMSGLAMGGLLASRWNVRSMSEEQFVARLAACAFAFAGGLTVAMIGILAFANSSIKQDASFGVVAIQALLFLPGLTAAGAFLATAFARNANWIGRLYAYDLVAAALACGFAIMLMRAVPGPAALLVPALFSSFAGLLVGALPRGLKLSGVGISCITLIIFIIGAGSQWELLRLEHAFKEPIYERWNEHSRIHVFNVNQEHASQDIVIDKSASTVVPDLKARKKGEPLPVEEWWNQGETYLGYRLGRPLENVAIIGVGGGMDVLGALGSGAKHVDGYELNGIIIDYHKRVLEPEQSIAYWPEVELIHDEARVAITHSGKKYDVIQASMIDTWAATASGGFVLSENGLYTLEGWDVLLSSLTDTGVLSMTRWYFNKVETYRLVALATQALKERGIADPRRHIMLAGPNKWALATIIVSKIPFSDAEITQMTRLSKIERLNFLALPTYPVSEPTIAALLDPTTRGITVAKSDYDLSPPTDLRPYFFLLLRPMDVLFNRTSEKNPPDREVTEITFNGIRVLVIMTVLSILFAVGVFVLGSVWLPATQSAVRFPRGCMGIYFLSIGLGYIFAQLGLHQRLILILGHPTQALSVVLFSMLLGTGLGSAASEKLFKPGRYVWAWVAVLLTLSLAILLFPLVPVIGTMNSFWLRIICAGSMVGLIGFVLGFGFPIGVRLVASAGEWTVQRMWAINGAATIAGSALAAITGVIGGSRANLIAAVMFYTVTLIVGWWMERASLSESDAGAISDKA